MYSHKRCQQWEPHFESLDPLRNHSYEIKQRTHEWRASATLRKERTETQEFFLYYRQSQWS